MNSILQNRAEKLARSRKKTDEKKNDKELLIFSLNEEKWGMELSWIEEVYQIKEPTALPLAPTSLYGLINVRRRVIPIFNIKAFFDFPSHVYSQKNRAIILSNGKTRFGILADEILGIKAISEKNIQPLPAGLTDVREEFLSGVTTDGIAIIDVKRLEASPRLQVKS